MIVFRFLLNEKGRVNPDSIRYMRQANMLPIIDNTTAPLGYPFSIWLFTNFGLDEFWSSKVVGILAYTVMLFFAYRNRFLFDEIVILSALFSFVSVFSYTMSEALILPFIFFILYYSKQIIEGRTKGVKAIFLLSLLLIVCYNIRYSALFIVLAIGIFGVINYKKIFAKYFIISAVIAVVFVVFYKFTYVDYFNKDYVKDFLIIGIKPTTQLLTELWQGLSTSFNPFVHIANPAGGLVNYGIYGIGIINLLVLIFIIVKSEKTIFDQLLIIVTTIGIACSFFVQYFYSVNAIDYRLLAPFSLSIWLFYFKNLKQHFKNIIYIIPMLSLCTGFLFTYLSRGNYLENRKIIKEYLESQNMKTEQLLFFLASEEDLANIRTVEIISTVNPKIYITMIAKDTLNPKVLTPYRVEEKIKISRNNFQKFNKN